MTGLRLLFTDAFPAIMGSLSDRVRGKHGGKLNLCLCFRFLIRKNEFDGKKQNMSTPHQIQMPNRTALAGGITKTRGLTRGRVERSWERYWSSMYQVSMQVRSPSNH
jgi:hypothetical protein